MLKGFLILIIFSTVSVANETQFIRDAYFKSYKHQSNKNYKEAIKALSLLYKKYPKGYTLNLRMAYLYYLSKEYNKAIIYYKKASKIIPSSNEAKLGLTKVYLASKKYKQAQTLAYAMLKTDYYSFYGNLYAIQALVAQNKNREALRIINKMLAVFPTNISYLEELAMLYKKTNNNYLNDIYETLYILDPSNRLLNSVKRD